MYYLTKKYMQEKTCSTEMVNELHKRGTHKIHKAKYLVEKYGQGFISQKEIFIDLHPHLCTENQKYLSF